MLVQIHLNLPGITIILLFRRQRQGISNSKLHIRFEVSLGYTRPCLRETHPDPIHGQGMKEKAKKRVGSYSLPQLPPARSHLGALIIPSSAP